MAFDFDGTLAVNGDVSPEVETALEQCRASGHVLFLVTGRRFETVTLGHFGELFAGVVRENGAVLSHAASGETYLPFGQLDPRLLKAMEDAGIPFERGLTIAATWTPYDQALWRILSAHGGTTSIEYNKGAVMVLPPEATKGSGLERLLALCGLFPTNLAAFGDAENDLSMLTLAEVSVAVADAVPAVIDTSDVLAKAPGPHGVLEILTAYPLGRQFLDIPLKRERPILVGQTESGTAIHIPAARLAGLNRGVFGNSATRKSWMVGLLEEELHLEDYQVLLIDPEGDIRGPRVLPRFVSISGGRATLLAPSAVASLIEEGGVFRVVDLSHYPVTIRSHYVAELYELSHLIPTLPTENLEYHDHREDFVKWAEGTLGDAVLATRIRKVPNHRYVGRRRTPRGAQPSWVVSQRRELKAPVTLHRRRTSSAWLASCEL